MTERVRRDPHAEREARRQRAAAMRAESVENPPPAPAETSGGRARRDPHAERAARRQGVPTARPAASPALNPARNAAQEKSEPILPLKVIEAPAFLVLVVPDLDDARLSSHDRDALGAGRILADAGGGAVLAVSFSGPDGARDDLGEGGADRVTHFASPQFAGYAPERRAAAILALAARLSPRHIVFPDSSVGGGDVGRRVAARLGVRAAGNVQRLGAGDIVRRAAGGRSDIALAPARVLLIAPESADPVVEFRHEGRAVEADIALVSEASPCIEDQGLAATDPNKVPLGEADFIVSGGNGVVDWEGFRRLAAALGASEGGSRPACDAGHLPRHRQVGASGTLVEPRCYIALGIAGAPQHLQGIAKAERVVAVNADPHCDMVKRAELAVVGDVQGFMPALERLARERRRGA
ncbi:MAG: electron transfer flavoprotein subunit alpha/FixB family protein [Alphaproteobacteria bacterium]